MIANCRFDTRRNLALAAGFAFCASSGAAVGAEPPTGGAPVTYALHCQDGSDVVVRILGTEAWVFRPGSGLRLAEVPGSIPTRYASDGVQVEIEGQDGRIKETGKDVLACRNDARQAVWEAAKLDGVDFRAVGNEPPWLLEIREQARLILTTEYGTKRIERPLPPAVNDPERGSTRWDAGDLQVEATLADCHDVMSGESFGTKVVVRWQGEELRGCGRALH